MNREVKKDQYNHNCQVQGFLGVALKTLFQIFPHTSPPKWQFLKNQCNNKKKRKLTTSFYKRKAALMS